GITQLLRRVATANAQHPGAFPEQLTARSEAAVNDPDDITTTIGKLDVLASVRIRSGEPPRLGLVLQLATRAENRGPAKVLLDFLEEDPNGTREFPGGKISWQLRALDRKNGILVFGIEFVLEGTECPRGFIPVLDLGASGGTFDDLIKQLDAAAEPEKVLFADEDDGPSGDETLIDDKATPAPEAPPPAAAPTPQPSAPEKPAAKPAPKPAAKPAPKPAASKPLPPISTISGRGSKRRPSVVGSPARTGSSTSCGRTPTPASSSTAGRRSPWTSSGTSSPSRGSTRRRSRPSAPVGTLGSTRSAARRASERGNRTGMDTSLGRSSPSSADCRGRSPLLHLIPIGSRNGYSGSPHALQNRVPHLERSFHALSSRAGDKKCRFQPPADRFLSPESRSRSNEQDSQEQG
ncbi:MAG: hypothetical protein KDD44_09565, partial [Bdellovibrionales bacterium]|nr:hypothetical protein [Bdellovibrionales bacterium]